MKPTINNKQLSKIHLKGFKSIADCELELGVLNVLIGSNGAGKSNFIGFFKMIQQMMNHNLRIHVSRGGGPDAFLHFGRQKTHRIQARLHFGNNAYTYELEPTQDNQLMFLNESIGEVVNKIKSIGKGHFETEAFEEQKTKIDQYMLDAMRDWKIYHFHDTSETAKVKQIHGINDNNYLRSDGSNLAAFLYFLKKKYPKRYDRIVKTIQLAAPFFGDFHLRPTPENKEQIELEWNERDSDIPFKAYQLSDGTLRFICLTTVLLQPPDKQPETILIDEPELGLHPFAITLLAALMRSASHKKQIIVSTQSVELLEEFDLEDVIVVDRKAGKSMLKRLNPKELEIWLEDYSLGELWKKNILGGRPSR